ncbi:MAG: cytochrome c [Thermodesulfobacteriota bacterium]|nr:cytochrome c [Thermodesulfobacteriota bacterium]
MTHTRRIIGLMLIALIFCGGLGIAIAADAFSADGNDRKGKYLYRKSCRTCHDGGAAAQALSPNSKTQAQWQRAFERYERVECVDEWKKLSQNDLNDIYTYLYNHAYDSPQPATCE